MSRHLGPEIRRRPVVLALLPLAAISAACGEPTTGAVKPFRVYPEFAEIVLGTSLQFEAVELGTGDVATVSWELAARPGISCGTLSDKGLYTAPPTLPNPPCAYGSGQRIVVRAASTRDPSTTDSAVAYLTAGIRTISILPFEPAVEPGDTVLLQATVESMAGADTTLVWGCQRGTIDSTGLYVAPFFAGTDPVRVHARADSTITVGASFSIQSTLITFNDLYEGSHPADRYADAGIRINQTDYAGAFIVEDAAGDPGFPDTWKPLYLTGGGWVPGPSGSLACTYTLRFDFLRTVSSVEVWTLGGRGTRLSAFDSQGSLIDTVRYPQGFGVREITAPGIAYVIIDSPPDAQNPCHVHDNIHFRPENVDWEATPPVSPVRTNPVATPNARRNQTASR